MTGLRRRLRALVGPSRRWLRSGWNGGSRLDTSAIVKRSFIDLEQECTDVYPA